MQIDSYYGPTIDLDDASCRKLVQDLRECASVALGVGIDDLPNYQCLKIGEDARKVLSDKVLVVVRADERVVAFTSAVLLDIPPLTEKVVHLGLTCITPTEESRGFTKLLVGGSMMVCAAHLGKNEKEIWVTNAASIISSLGSIALNFQDVFPSPSCPTPPSPTHKHIIQSVINSPEILQKMYVAPAMEGRPIRYDEVKSVIAGSAKGTVFEKTTEEKQSFKGKHRMEEFDRFYRGLIDFERGDEVLQVARVDVKRIWAYRPTVSAKL